MADTKTEKTEGFYILVGNLSFALQGEIERREDMEKKWGYFMDSAYLAGLKTNLNYLHRHGTLEVRSKIS